MLAEQATTPFDPLDLVYPDEIPIWEKYDEYVPIELIRKGFAESVLDIDGMLKRVRPVVRPARREAAAAPGLDAELSNWNHMEFR